jgi:hypothetical protein
MDPMDDIVEPAPPELLMVEEASKVMRIGRQLAYDLANDYLASGGTQGLPVIRFGVKCLRVPRWALLELVSTGNVVRLCDGRVSRGAAGGD